MWKLLTSKLVDLQSRINTLTVTHIVTQHTISSYIHTHKHNRRSLINTLIYGLAYATSQTTIVLVYPIILRFGAFQVLLDTSNIAYVLFGEVFRVIFAVMFGGVGVGQAGAFAPNYTKARLSANRIFFLLNRKPVIDGYSEEGTKPVSFFAFKICIMENSEGKL